MTADLTPFGWRPHCTSSATPSRETLESLALRLGRPETLVEPVLGQLVELRILERRGRLYRYCRPYVAAAWDESPSAR